MAQRLVQRFVLRTNSLYANIITTVAIINTVSIIIIIIIILCV